MKQAFIFIFIFLIFSSGCKGKERRISDIKRDTTITKKNAYSDLFLDSVKLESFISSEQPGKDESKRLRNFYNGRNFQFAWFTKEGLAEHTRAFWNLQQSHILLSKDSLLLDTSLANRIEVMMTEDTVITDSANEITRLELALTLHFFKYVQYAYAGRVDPEEIS